LGEGNLRSEEIILQENVAGWFKIYHPSLKNVLSFLFLAADHRGS